MRKDDFVLAQGSYLLNHSVGRPLKTSQTDFTQQFFAPWQQQGMEPWQQWLAAIERFTCALSLLFNSPQTQFCPQVNLSSGLTKLLMSHPRLQARNCKVLMAQADFPSMGFAMQKALPSSAEIHFIAEHHDLTDSTVWQQHLQGHNYDLVFISHAYSNTGQQAPIAEIIKLAKQQHTLSLLDVAQSAGVLPIDLTELDADFMLGSSVKWLCGGPGAAYLWLNKEQLNICQPKDVGWFSHQHPFEFDIKHFSYHDSALRFWGGTPSVAPYVLAGHSIEYFVELGIKNVRAHNWQLIKQLHAAFTNNLVSPLQENSSSGTVILHFAKHQQRVLENLQRAGIAVDERALGLRLSPHVYNDSVDIENFIDVVKHI